jgi:hypothetical protein
MRNNQCPRSMPTAVARCRPVDFHDPVQPRYFVPAPRGRMLVQELRNGIRRGRPTCGRPSVGDANDEAGGSDKAAIDADTPAQAAARAWLHSYGEVSTHAYTRGGSDYPAMRTLPQAFEACAARGMPLQSVGREHEATKTG